MLGVPKGYAETCWVGIIWRLELEVKKFRVSGSGRRLRIKDADCLGFRSGVLTGGLC